MKKGFTLIELLAVIVILAIIAVIAVPIVLNIIDETKNNAGLRSAEMYVKALELSIAQSTLKDKNITDDTYNLKDGDICLNETCTDKLDVEVNGKVPTSGTITITNGNISDLSIVLNEKTIVKNSEGKLVYQTTPAIEKGKFSSVCKPAEGTEYNTTAGTKYTCEVKEGTTYTFYVLNATSTEVNLIMDQNINSDGTPAGMTVTAKNGDNVYNLVSWNSSGSNAGGPVDAMQFLYNATKDWTNIEPITYEYKDKEYQGTTDSGYTSFVAKEGVLTITALDETATTTIGTSDEPLRARMPIYSYVISEKGEVSNLNEKNSYLYDNLLELSGYWTLSSVADSQFPNNAWILINSVGGMVVNDEVISKRGVRPVINLKI